MTRHGHVRHPGEPWPPPLVARCGGPAICSSCAKELSETKEATSTGDIGHGDFAIGSQIWPGISKLIEEAGEVQQVAGKLLGSRGNTAHWDDTDLRARLIEEIADLQAATVFVITANDLDRKAIDDRRVRKLALFRQWHAEGDPL